MDPILVAVVLGIIFGFISRLILLRTDYRQYPSYPQGRIIHLSLGFIASFIGAVATPALWEGDWTAVTFLGLAATQFREIRKMERETLDKVDEMELVKRGAPFIEGMAQAFEGRNYLVMFTALITTLFATLFNLVIGAMIGIGMLIFVKYNRSGKVLTNIAHVKEATLHFEGSNLFVDDILIKNVGLKISRETILNHGVGVIVIPLDPDSKVTLSHLGQQQAMLHHIANILGIYRDAGDADLVPLAKRDKDDGRIGLFILPQEKGFEKIKQVLEQVPILDNAIRLPSKLTSIK